MYIFEEVDSVWWVIHQETRVFMRYNSGRVDEYWLETVDASNAYDLFATWIEMSRGRRKKLKAVYTMVSKKNVTFANFASLICTPQGNPVPCQGPELYPVAVPCTPNKKEEVMNVIDTNEIQRRYLKDRAYVVKSKHHEVLAKHFGLVDAPQPKTVKEFIEFIKNDQFKYVDDKAPDRKIPWSVRDAVDYIRFRDPSIKEDQEGFDKAFEKVDEAYDTLRDDITILEPKEGLEKLRAFEAATFH